MKTDKVPINRMTPYNVNDRKQSEVEKKEIKSADEAKTDKLIKPASKKIKLDKAVINNQEAVQKLIGENIKWRELNFYQRNEGSQVYIDVVDKNTGNVIRTIPDTKFAEIAEKFKRQAGLKIDISG
ncbi:flagellar protein FlaG [bacterium]|nr:flagellar protein FlaG [bacterium]